MAVVSAGPYANNLHLAPDRQPDQHLIAQFLQAGCCSRCPTNSVKALKASYHPTKYRNRIRPPELFRAGSMAWPPNSKTLGKWRRQLLRVAQSSRSKQRNGEADVQWSCRRALVHSWMSRVSAAGPAAPPLDCWSLWWSGLWSAEMDSPHAAVHSPGYPAVNSFRMTDWLTCCFTSDTTQTRSFQGRFPKPPSLGPVRKKLNLTRQKHAFTDQKKSTTTQNKHKTKARFSRLLWYLAWKRSGSILKGKEKSKWRKKDKFRINTTTAHPQWPMLMYMAAQK